MYLDSEGYLTIGKGSLISKLDGEIVQRLVKNLQVRPYEELKTDQFETFDTDQIEALYREPSIRSALQKVNKFEFEIGHGKKAEKGESYSIDIYKRSPLFAKEKEVAIRAAFDELLRKSVLLKAQQKKLGSKYEPSTAKSFFTYEGKKGSNNLVIDVKEIDVMAKGMIKEKIHHLKQYLPKSGDNPGFDGYPFSVQIALLDMSYNMGAKKLLDTPAIEGGFEQFTKLVKGQQWEEIVKTNHYFRRQVSKDRNKFVKEQFKKAVK